MQLYERKEQCCGCGACANVCPVSAISMQEDREGFEYPITDKSACIGCCKCLTVCAIKRRNENE